MTGPRHRIYTGWDRKEVEVEVDGQWYAGGLGPAGRRDAAAPRLRRRLPAEDDSRRAPAVAVRRIGLAQVESGTPIRPGGAGRDRRAGRASGGVPIRRDAVRRRARPAAHVPPLEAAAC